MSLNGVLSSHPATSGEPQELRCDTSSIEGRGRGDCKKGLPSNDVNILPVVADTILCTSDTSPTTASSAL